MMSVYVVSDVRDTEANMLLDKLQVLNSIVDDHEVYHCIYAYDNNNNNNNNNNRHKHSSTQITFPSAGCVAQW